jgi:hypothetical protein
MLDTLVRRHLGEGIASTKVIAANYKYCKSNGRSHATSVSSRLLPDMSIIMTLIDSGHNEVKDDLEESNTHLHNGTVYNISVVRNSRVDHGLSCIDPKATFLRTLSRRRRYAKSMATHGKVILTCILHDTSHLTSDGP